MSLAGFFKTVANDATSVAEHVASAANDVATDAKAAASDIEAFGKQVISRLMSPSPSAPRSTPYGAAAICAAKSRAFGAAPVSAVGSCPLASASPTAGSGPSKTPQASSLWSNLAAVIGLLTSPDAELLEDSGAILVGAALGGGLTFGAGALPGAITAFGIMQNIQTALGDMAVVAQLIADYQRGDRGQAFAEDMIVASPALLGSGLIADVAKTSADYEQGASGDVLRDDVMDVCFDILDSVIAQSPLAKKLAATSAGKKVLSVVEGETKALAEAAIDTYFDDRPSAPTEDP